MAQTPEGKVKDKIKVILKRHNVYYTMPMGTGFGSAGVPDFLCCFNGKFTAIEAKAGKGTTTALQRKNLGEIEACGGDCWVVDELNVHLFEIWVKEGHL